MRLLDTETGQFVEKDRADEETVYAILSHTWDTEKGEQTYNELKKIQRRYGLGPQAPQSRHVELEGGAFSSQSPDRDRAGSSSTPHPSKLPGDSQLAATPLIPPSRPSKSWLTSRIARLKRWLPRSSARNAPQPPDDSSTVTTCQSPTTLGRLTQSEVEALVRTVAEAYDLTSPTSVPAPSDPSAPSQECRSEPRLHQSIWDDRDLSPKIRDACAVARKNGYRYIWIDSCCIDKSSSSELSEAINSMYRWYALAAVCYAYLADVSPGDEHYAASSRFRTSRWFGRGWTLQELIAPGWVEFLSDDWAPIGSKQSLVELVESVSNIHYKALLRLKPLEEFSIAQRLSWAAQRQTTRKEDRAYSLLGIFNIHMPTLYGEGDHAFRRLQEQIMQRIPDQSLFAWQDVYLSSQLSQSPDLADNPKSLRVEVRPYYGQQHLFATSPDIFKRCEGIQGHAPHRDTIQFPESSHLYGIEYTSTPYGIRTQFRMIPLTRDLLLHTIPNCEDIQLHFPGSLEGHRWYLAVLGCEHAEYSGHILGRVCYTSSSSEGSVESIYTGYINLISRQDGDGLLGRPDLFPLSPETVEHYRPQTELKTVHIPRPDRPHLLSSLQYQPYTEIKLVLLKDTRDALRSARGYSADLRKPTPDHPTTHWLTLTKDEHVITAKLQHTLENAGKRFILVAQVKMSGRGSQRLELSLDSTADSDHSAACHTISWTDPRPPWLTKLDPQSVRLSAAGTGTLTVDLALDFAGTGVYVLRVDVLSCNNTSGSVSSAVESAVRQVEEIERTGEGSCSDGINAEVKANWEVRGERGESEAGSVVVPPPSAPNIPQYQSIRY